MTVRFAWITDIPTPYRNHQFERMAAIFPSRGVQLMVHFMALSHPQRPWRFAPEELRYPWKVYAEWGAPLRRRAIHVNPGLATALRRDAPDVAMVGGWASPSHVAAAFVLPRRVVKILGCESHAGSVARTGGIARAVKGAIVRQYDAFLVTGARSRELLVSLDPAAAAKPCVTLPNVIDASLFRDRAAALAPERARLRAELAVAEDVQLWICPARLEPVKGLLEFVPLLAGVRGIELLIAGEGELRPALEAAIARDRLPVRLLGLQPPSRMVELYAAADVFVLPSLSDPSPLAAVEAAAAGLPLLMSNRCGNVDDLVEEDHNGWVLDVESGDARGALLSRIAATPRPTLRAMGARSRDLYAARFDTDTCIARLADFIVELHARSHRHSR